MPKPKINLEKIYRKVLKIIIKLQGNRAKCLLIINKNKAKIV